MLTGYRNKLRAAKLRYCVTTLSAAAHYLYSKVIQPNAASVLTLFTNMVRCFQVGRQFSRPLTLNFVHTRGGMSFPKFPNVFVTSYLELGQIGTALIDDSKSVNNRCWI